MATKMQQRRGTAAEWTAANETVPAGSIGVEEDTGKFKLGKDLPWNSTGYAAIPPSLIDAVGDLIVGSADNVAARLARGTTGQRLAVGEGGILTWVDDAFLSKITAAGDLVVGSGSGTAARLAIGSNGKVLGVSSGALAWVTPSADVPLATVTAAGDLIVATGNAAVGRLAKGSNNQVLAVVGGALVWADLPADPTLSAITTAGDIVVGTGAGAIGRLARGSNGQVLTMNGTSVAWVMPNALSTIDAAGDLLVGTANDTLGRLPIGSNGKVLGVSGGAVAWVTPTGNVVCTSGTRPSHAAGLHIYETDTGLEYVSDGSAWNIVPSATKPGAFIQGAVGGMSVVRRIQQGVGSYNMTGGGTNNNVQGITYGVAFNQTPASVMNAQYVLGSVSQVIVNSRPKSTPLTGIDYMAYSTTSSYTGTVGVNYIASDS